MEELKKIFKNDMPHTKQIIDRHGFDVKKIPEATAENVNLLVDKINELVDHIESLQHQITRIKYPNDPIL